MPGCAASAPCARRGRRTPPRRHRCTPPGCCSATSMPVRAQGRRQARPFAARSRASSAGSGHAEAFDCTQTRPKLPRDARVRDVALVEQREPLPAQAVRDRRADQAAADDDQVEARVVSHRPPPPRSAGSPESAPRNPGTRGRRRPRRTGTHRRRTPPPRASRAPRRRSAPAGSSARAGDAEHRQRAQLVEVRRRDDERRAGVEVGLRARVRGEIVVRPDRRIDRARRARRAARRGRSRRKPPSELPTSVSHRSGAATLPSIQARDRGHRVRRRDASAARGAAAGSARAAPRPPRSPRRP